MNIRHNPQNKEVIEELKKASIHGNVIPFPGKTIINPMKLQFLYRSIFFGDNDRDTICPHRNS